MTTKTLTQMVEGFVTPKECPRCSGRGDYTYASGGIGTCARCMGAGVVESNRAAIAATKATNAKDAAAMEALFDLIRTTARGFRTPSEAKAGYAALRVLEPARYAKAQDSILAGHPAVIEALAAYGREHRVEGAAALA